MAQPTEDERILAWQTAIFDDNYSGTFEEYSEEQGWQATYDNEESDSWGWLRDLGDSDIFEKGGLISDIWSNFKKDPDKTNGGGGNDDKDDPEDSKKKFIIVTSVVFGLLLVIGIAVYFLTKGDK